MSLTLLIFPFSQESLQEMELISSDRPIGWHVSSYLADRSLLLKDPESLLCTIVPENRHANSAHWLPVYSGPIFAWFHWFNYSCYAFRTVKQFGCPLGLLLHCCQPHQHTNDAQTASPNFGTFTGRLANCGCNFHPLPLVIKQCSWTPNVISVHLPGWHLWAGLLR